MFEIELSICINMDSAITTYSGLYTIKRNQTKSFNSISIRIFNIMQFVNKAKGQDEEQLTGTGAALKS